MLTFASVFASNFNILSMVMLLIQRIGTEHILCFYILLPLVLLFSKSKRRSWRLEVQCMDMFAVPS